MHYESSTSASTSTFILLQQMDVFLDLFEEVAGEDEVGETFVVGGEDVVLGALPVFVALIDEDDVFAYTEHGVHVVGVDDGGHAVFLGDTVDEGVDDE